MIKGDIKGKEYYKYAEDVIKKRIPAGEYIRLACERFMKDLKRKDIIFDVKKADNMINFVGCMRHSDGEFAGQYFKMLPWQQWVCANIYGFLRPDGSRKYTTAYIEISRKSGKSSLASAFAIWGLIEEPGAQVICAANSREQASILLNCATGYIRTIDPEQKDLRIYRSEVKLRNSNSFLKIVAAQTGKLDGLNCSTFVIDEFHEAPDTRMYDVLRSSQGMRKSPLGIIITTAGFNLDGPCYEMRTVQVDCLRGLKDDDSTFAAIYSIDENDDWKDKKNWYKSNPCLGITVKEKYLVEQVHQAAINPSLEVGVKTKNMNLWCQSAEVWIKDTVINGAMKKLDFTEFNEDICFASIDLSAVSDLTCINYMVKKDGIYYFRTDYYLPESALTDTNNALMYNQWAKKGYLKLTPGNTTDYDYILKDLMYWSGRLNIYKIGYDQWNSSFFVIKATEEGLPMQPYSQTTGSFNKPCREFERQILQGNVYMEYNPITRWCFQNAKLKFDNNDNCKPVKGGGKSKKIDGCITVLQSMGLYLESPLYGGEITVI